MGTLSIRKIVKSWWFTVLATAFLLILARSAVADWNYVPTGSMNPTILEGDGVFVVKAAYDLRVPFTLHRIASWKDPERGDIVVFISPADGRRLVKRVAGVPGDIVSMDKNRLFINGAALPYKNIPPPSIPQGEAVYLLEDLTGCRHMIKLTPSHSLLESFGTVKIPDGFYLMLGDNRNNSADSRVFGYVPRRSILGRATAVAVSLDINRGYQPRWERFFMPLQ